MKDTMNASAHRPELIEVADSVAREKNIEREDVFAAMEMALQKAAKTKYGQELDIRAHIDRATGEVELRRYREVVEAVANDETELSLDAAQKLVATSALGEFITDVLPPVDMGRISAQTAKQVIIQRVRDAERDRQFNEFKDRIGTIASGTVKRVDYGSVTIDLGRTEAILRKDEFLPRENFRLGDRVRAYVRDVRRELRGPQVFLSRTHPQFMARLFEQEVPEIYDGLIEIKAVSRDPGSRAKLGVYATDSSIDPVGSCVGMRGGRVQAVVNELGGEKVDIVLWSDNIATLAVAALKPVDVLKVLVDEVEKSLDVVVADENLSIAIGRRGQNVRLASQLIGWHINVLTQTQEADRRQNEIAQLTSLFKESLDVDDVIAHLLISEGFTLLEDVALVPLEEIASIEGFDEDVAQEIQNRAKNYIQGCLDKAQAELKALNVEKALMTFKGLNAELLLLLAQSNVVTLEDFADLAADEAQEILAPATTKKLDITDLQDLILKARIQAGWFSEDEAAAE